MYLNLTKMAFSVTNFTTIVLISMILCFQNVIKADIYAYQACINAIILLCDDKSMNVQNCAQRAVMHYTNHTIDQHYLFLYYIHLSGLMLVGPGMQSPEQFCSGREERCLDDLAVFLSWINDTEVTPGYNELLYGIKDYAFQSLYFHEDTSEHSYFIDYLRHISQNIIPDPFTKCMLAMQEFCNDESMNVQNCARRAIMHYTNDSIDQVYLKQYYYELNEAMHPGREMLMPIQFCNNKKKRCVDDLKVFMEKRPNILKVANQLDYTVKLTFQTLYYGYADYPMPNSYFIDYLRHISLNTVVRDDSGSLDPRAYCNQWLQK